MEHQITCVQKGTLHFKWEGGKKVSVACIVEEGHIIQHEKISMIGLGQLMSVTVEYGKNKEGILCMECQDHLLEKKMVELHEGSGEIEEVLECSNPNCPNKAF